MSHICRYCITLQLATKCIPPAICPSEMELSRPVRTTLGQLHVKWHHTPIWLSESSNCLWRIGAKSCKANHREFLTEWNSDVTIIESKSKIAILARNRIGSKSRFPCTTETILSIVAFAHSHCCAVMRYRSHQCSAGARTCLSSAGEHWVTAAGLKCDCGRGAGV